MKLIVVLSILLFGGLASLSAQTPKINNQADSGTVIQAIRSSPAFSEVILRRAELEAELESLLLDFTEEYPKIKAARYGLSQLQKQIDLLLAVKAADAGKLTLALGKLMVKKVELETDLWSLQQNLADGHPDVKRARRKVEIFEKAIKDILG